MECGYRVVPGHWFSVSKTLQRGPMTFPNALSIADVAASRQFHDRADRRDASTRDAGVHSDGEDAPVLLMTPKVFGEVVLLPRSSRRR